MYLTIDTKKNRPSYKLGLFLYKNFFHITNNLPPRSHIVNNPVIPHP